MYLNKTTSIICAAYNAGSYIEETILSILGQTMNDWELIIIDDCSQDNTVIIVEKYIKQYSNIILVRNLINCGPGISRNNGIKRAKGRYLAICDSDDIWYPEKLELQLAFMKQLGDVPISYTSYELMNSKGESLDRRVIVANKPIGYCDYLKNTIIGFSTAIIDRKLCPDIVLSDLRSREDTFLWCSLLKAGFKAYGVNKVLVRYRIHNTSVSSDKIKAARQVWKLYRDRLHIPLIMCTYYFSCYAFHALKKRFG